MFRTSESCIKLHAVVVLELLLSEQCVCVSTAPGVCVCVLGVDRYVFFRADTDYYRSSRPITDILNRYTCLV